MKAIGSHPNIIECVEFADNVKRVQEGIGIDAGEYLAMEFALNGSLVDYVLYKNEILIGEKWARYWFKQILAGLK